MPARLIEDEIGRLYQLPLDEFTSARNALAKQAGGDAARIRALAKPSVPAWAVNQLHWRERQSWDRLIAAAENARAVNRAVLGGKSGDVRAANQVHEEAVEAALKTTLAQLTASGHPITDATKQAIATTLRTLPGEDAPGRLTKALQPGGFAALYAERRETEDGRRKLAGSRKLEAGSRTLEAASRQPEAGRRQPEAGSGKPEASARDITRERQAEAAAARELKEAEAAARRGEFEVARLEREEQRAQDSLKKAREAVERAEADLRRADKEADAAAAATRAAKERARKAQEALARAKKP